MPVLEASLAMLSSCSGEAGRRVGVESESSPLDWVSPHSSSSPDMDSLLSIACSDKEG